METITRDDLVIRAKQIYDEAMGSIVMIGDSDVLANIDARRYRAALAIIPLLVAEIERLRIIPEAAAMIERGEAWGRIEE